MAEFKVSDLPVMKKCCKTCPFKTDAHGRQQNPELAGEVTVRTLFKAQQICHGTEGENRKPNHRCRGSYDYNTAIYARMGMDLTQLD